MTNIDDATSDPPNAGSVRASESAGWVGRAWIGLHVQNEWSLPSAQQLRALFAVHRKAAAQATLALLEHIGQFATPPIWPWLVGLWRHLRRDVELWTAVGFALGNRGRWLGTWLWLRDYRRRNHVPARALLVLALAQTRWFGWRSALQLAKQALEGSPGTFAPILVGFVSAGCALEGHPEEARSILIHVPASSGHNEPWAVLCEAARLLSVGPAELPATARHEQLGSWLDSVETLLTTHGLQPQVLVRPLLAELLPRLTSGVPRIGKRALALEHAVRRPRRSRPSQMVPKGSVPVMALVVFALQLLRHCAQYGP